MSGTEEQEKPHYNNILPSWNRGVARIVQYRGQEAVRTEQLDFREVGAGR